MKRLHALVVQVEDTNGHDHYQGHDIALLGSGGYPDVVVGHRPYDGSNAHEVVVVVTETLAAMLRDRLGWAKTAPERTHE